MKILLKNCGALLLAIITFFLGHTTLPADIIYVWNGNGTLQKIATNGVATVMTNNLSGWNGSVGLTCDNVGNLYAGVPGESYIWKFSPDGTRTLVGYIDSVSALAFNFVGPLSGRLYIAIPNYRELLLTAYGQGYGYYSPHPETYTQSHLTFPIGLAFNNKAVLYVANNSNADPLAFLWGPNFSVYDNTVEMFTTNFTSLGNFASDLNQPWGIAFGPDNNLYVANSGTSNLLSNTILKIGTNGAASTFANESKGLNNPHGLAFDSAGNLYVANTGNGNIVKIRTNGVSSVFSSGLNSPVSLSIYPGMNVWSAVPISINAPKIQPDGTLAFEFVASGGLPFTVLATTNLALPKTNWTALQGVTRISANTYQFIDSQATNGQGRFYQVRSP